MLRADHLTVSFGGLRAVDRVDIRAEAGEFLGVIGPNGCGKSTLLNALTGVVPATGAVQVDGNRLPLGDPTAAYRAGLSRVFQAPQMFDGLSVLENVAVGCRDHRSSGIAAAIARRPSMWRRERARWELARTTLDRVGLSDVVDLSVDSLSYGRRRLVELARSLASEPSVLLLDEPSAGLNDTETAELAVLLADLHRTGLTVVMVDHKIDFVDRLCERLMVLETGRTIAEGPPSRIWADQRVMDAYLGVADA